MKRCILGLFALILTATTATAQEQPVATAVAGTDANTGAPRLAGAADTVRTPSKKELRRQRVAQRNFHYNILGGPSYTPDFGALIGGSALLTFRMNPGDTTQLRSVLPISIAYIFKGGINLMVKPQLFFKGDRFRIFGKVAYKNTEDNYYGIGYSTNRDYVRSDRTSRYRYSGVQVNPWFLFRLGESNVFAGPQVDINYDHFTEPGELLAEEPGYVAAGGTPDGYRNFDSGLGFLLTYDSRDIPANAYRGMYLDFRGMVYSKVLGSYNNFYRLELDYRQYRSVGHRKVIAWTAQSKHALGHVPLTQYPLTGTPFDLRGYYMGQYRDKSSHVVVAEYRQMINTDRSTRLKRLLHHLGFVAWTGCGFMGPTMGKIEGVLPNYGVGLRIEVQPRMNVRLDLGKNTVNKQTLFYFNMTEAF